MFNRKTSLCAAITALMIAGASLPVFASDGTVYYFRTKGQITGNADIEHSISFEGTEGEVFNGPLSSELAGFTFSISSGVLPDGVTFDIPSQSFVGTPTATGTFSLILKGIHSNDGRIATANVSLKISVAPPLSHESPDIADQPKSILGVAGATITWMPQTPSGWSSSVVESDSRLPWNQDLTVFSSSDDLSQFGLDFDPATGAITGTPHTPFIIEDFTITVASSGGSYDTTDPFWIGVAPSTPMEVSSTQEYAYIFRLGANFSTAAISVAGTIGDLLFDTPVGITSGWDTSAGLWAQDGSGQTLESVNRPVSYTTTIRDEFNRTLDWSFIVDFALPLSIPEFADATAYYDTTYTSVMPVATLNAPDLLGSPTWTADGLPEGLEIEEATGKIIGAVSTTSLYTDGQSFDVSLTLHDDYDGSEAVGSATIIARIKETLDLALQVSTGDRHTCALKPNGSAWCWGRNNFGEVGNGSIGENVLSPEQVTALGSNVAAISAGFDQTCAIKTDRSVWCWGKGYGATPVNIPAASNARSVSAFGDRICAVKITGTAWCWTAGTAPLQVAGLSSVQSVATGAGYSCAVTANQDVWCWGNGSDGKLGNGSTASQNTPVKVQGLPETGSGVVRVEAGWQHTCAIARDGLTYCWGLNNRGQLGTGDTTPHHTAVKMENVGPARRVSVGYQYTCLAMVNGQAACVGFGEYGKLGSGNNNNKLLPEMPIGLPLDVIDITIGGAQSIAMMSDSSLAVWGRNSSGELGTGDTFGSNIPKMLSFGD